MGSVTKGHRLSTRASTFAALREFNARNDRLVSESVIRRCRLDVRITLKSGRRADIGSRPKSANNGREQVQQQRSYSLTSSALASSVGGTTRPSAFAVLRLMTSSYLVGCCTR